ncbi:aminocarboxymuconate-semialdehyde decarboxylase [Micromonospora coriariae]|uniref:Aminocarboxymuconate-semialdehyde decarboxylase n=1 Tax=Micromonospora coriariae TaxID=285665 RepID=A0A1C4X481_9ACTN|nr:amidohydrolase family protein [Micromonospora coriariae]SCF03212.1 aminocarboxymuconate-semialdehyde decarboxylase [Micromonospora coriariae]
MQRTPIIDVHTHALPMPLLRDLEALGHADLSGLANRVLRLDSAISGLAPGAPIPLPAEQYDLATRLASVTAAGVDYQAVSPPPFTFASESTDERLVMDITRRTNDAVAEFVAGSGGRLVGLAALPVGFPGAVQELARCLDELGFVGATMGTFGGGRELDDPLNEELWSSLAFRRCFVLLHPSRASSPTRLADYHLLQLLGYPAETALATARLVFGGVLDRNDLILCLAHGGGCLPGIGARLDLGWHRKAVSRVIPYPPTHYLRRLRYDTAVFDASVLARLVEDVTPANVLLGTDAPYDLADRQPLATVRTLKIDTSEQDAILGGNAASLLQGMFRATHGGTAASDTLSYITTSRRS